MEERQEAYSKHSETKLAKGMFPQYVLLMKVNVKKYTVMSAVDIVIETIRRFMKSNIFCECYTLSLMTTAKILNYMTWLGKLSIRCIKFANNWIFKSRIQKHWTA